MIRPGRADDDVHAATQRGELDAVALAAVDRQHVHAAQVGGVPLERLAHLQRQLAGRRQHQRLRALLAEVEPLEDRQRERRGLAGAGLRQADQVAAREQRRDGLRPGSRRATRSRPRRAPSAPRRRGRGRRSRGLRRGRCRRRKGQVLHHSPDNGSGAGNIRRIRRRGGWVTSRERRCRSWGDVRFPRERGPIPASAAGPGAATWRHGLEAAGQGRRGDRGVAGDRAATALTLHAEGASVVAVSRGTSSRSGVRRLARARVGRPGQQRRSGQGRQRPPSSDSAVSHVLVNNVGGPPPGVTMPRFSFRPSRRRGLERGARLQPAERGAGSARRAAPTCSSAGARS